MADIDSLEIEISAESSSAAQKVNSLTQALRELKSVLQDSAFGSIRQQIAGIGEGAGEAQKKVARKQRVLQGTREKLQKEGPLKKVRVSVKSAQNDLSAELAEVPEAVKTVNGIPLPAPSPPFKGGKTPSGKWPFLDEVEQDCFALCLGESDTAPHNIFILMLPGLDLVSPVCVQKAGLYDLVGEQFYGNILSGSFTPGPAV